jgi:hypothetical protein
MALYQSIVPPRSIAPSPSPSSAPEPLKPHYPGEMASFPDREQRRLLSLQLAHSISMIQASLASDLLSDEQIEAVTEANDLLAKLRLSLPTGRQADERWQQTVQMYFRRAITSRLAPGFLERPDRLHVHVTEDNGDVAYRISGVPPQQIVVVRQALRLLLEADAPDVLDEEYGR